MPEADWKVLRRLHPLALERFCERVLGEINDIGRDSARSFHQRYLDIYQIVERRDPEIRRIFDDPRRSSAMTMLAHMRTTNTSALARSRSLPHGLMRRTQIALLSADGVRRERDRATLQDQTSRAR